MAFLYDSIITTGDVRCFWGHKVTGAAILFWLNKYASLLYFVWNLGAFMEIPEKVCIVETTTSFAKLRANTLRRCQTSLSPCT